MTLDLEDRPCPICGSADSSVLVRESTYDPSRWTDASFSSRKMPEYMHFRLLRCERCDMTYSSPVASVSTAADAYRTASFDASAESEDAARTYAEYLRRCGFSPGSALDIGAADGAFLRELRRLGFKELAGVEPSEAPLARAPDDVRHLIRGEMFDGSRFPAGSFDLVTCFQTIEHVYEPRTLLEDVHRILKPGGNVFLVGHDLGALSARVLGTKSPIYDIEHVQLFNRRSMRNLLTATGFESIRIFPIMNVHRFAYWVRLFPFPQPLKQVMLRGLSSSALGWLGRARVPLPAGNLAAFATSTPR